MAGDFFDVHRVGPTRVAAVIGDVAGHGIESSITAFQAKYLLRVFLRQFRDPAQAFEELNEQLAAGDRHEEFISAAVVVFDTEAGTLRYASAGHPPFFLFQEDGVLPLRSTGPLLMLDPKASYFSREIPMESGDLVVMYTDGLAEARRRLALRRGPHHQGGRTGARSTARRALQGPARCRQGSCRWHHRRRHRHHGDSSRLIPESEIAVSSLG